MQIFIKTSKISKKKKLLQLESITSAINEKLKLLKLALGAGAAGATTSAHLHGAKFTCNSFQGVAHVFFF